MLHHGDAGRRSIFTDADMDRYEEALRSLHESKLKASWVFEEQPKMTQRWSVKGLLPLDGLTMVYGASGSGKTFFVTDLACRISLGMPWRGRKVREGVVAYFAAEGPQSVADRMVAWQRRHDARCPVRLFKSPINLLDDTCVDEIVEELSKLKREFGYLGAVIFDTLAQSMVGDENSGMDMGAVVAALKRIKAAIAPTNVIIVHHSGKDAALGARGHSSLRAAVDTEIEVKRDGPARSAIARKMRDGVDGASYDFTLTPVVLGVDEDGDEVTSCVAEELEMGDAISGGAGDFASPISRPAGAADRIGFDSLTAAIADKGRIVRSMRDIPPKVMCVTVAEWRELFLRYYPDTKGEAEQEQAFRRTVRKLVAQRAVRHVKGHFWVPPLPETVVRTRPANVAGMSHRPVLH